MAVAKGFPVGSQVRVTTAAFLVFEGKVMTVVEPDEAYWHDSGISEEWVYVQDDSEDANQAHQFPFHPNEVEAVSA